MSKKGKAPETESAKDSAWDNRELGADADFVKVFEGNIDAQLDQALNMKPISIRMSQSLIEDLKMIASAHGMGYQPLMRQVLTRFVECEQKQLYRQYLAEKKRRERAEAQAVKQKSAA